MTLRQLLAVIALVCLVLAFAFSTLTLPLVGVSVGCCAIALLAT